MAFKDFIISLLKRGNLDDIFCEKLYTENVDVFKCVFTHRTYDPVNNYEYYEFVGDSVINACISEYIIRWDPNIVSVKYLTRLKHNITSKKQLSEIAHNLGFMEHIRLGKGDIKIKKNRGSLYLDYITEMKIDPIQDETYRSWLEDCLEAFIGAVSILIDKGSKYTGMGFVVCYNIISSLMEGVHLSLRYEDVFDPTTRYKELCDKYWGFVNNVQGKQTKCIRSYERKDKEGRTFHKTIVMGYPFGDKSAKKENEAILAEAEDTSKMESQHKACEMALRKLRDLYNLVDYPPDPYKKIN